MFSTLKFPLCSRPSYLTLLQLLKYTGNSIVYHLGPDKLDGNKGVVALTWTSFFNIGGLQKL